MIQVITFLFFAAIVNCLTNDDLNIFLSPLGKNKDECLIQSKAEPELVERLLVDVYFPKNERLKCYIKCAYSKVKVINENFQLDSNALKEILPMELTSEVDEIIKKCSNTVNRSECSKAHSILRCLFYYVKPLKKGEPTDLDHLSNSHTVPRLPEKSDWGNSDKRLTFTYRSRQRHRKRHPEPAEGCPEPLKTAPFPITAVEITCRRFRGYLQTFRSGSTYAEHRYISTNQILLQLKSKMLMQLYYPVHFPQPLKAQVSHRLLTTSDTENLDTTKLKASLTATTGSVGIPGRIICTWLRYFYPYSNLSIWFRKEIPEKEKKRCYANGGTEVHPVILTGHFQHITMHF
ncbi:hypothetical protein FQR65_LT07127 [Abscondita terminalis]|nr:hypothetical protein FQR65_LT07127 [Abscondita terminalis]